MEHFLKRKASGLFSQCQYCERAAMEFQLIILVYNKVRCATTLKTKGCQFDNFVVTGGTVSCRNDNLRCHQWRRSCQIDNFLFSVKIPLVRANPFVANPHRLPLMHRELSWDLPTMLWCVFFLPADIWHVFLSILTQWSVPKEPPHRSQSSRALFVCVRADTNSGMGNGKNNEKCVDGERSEYLGKGGSVWHVSYSSL